MKWSDQDDKTATNLYKIGAPMTQIGQRVNRTLESIKHFVRERALKREQARFQEYPVLIALPGEIWGAVGASPHYFVSSLGRVISMKLDNPGTILKHDLDVDGYHHVRIDGKRQAVHRLVASVFCPGQADGIYACHDDGNTHNNRHDNLIWKTQKENIADKVRHGTAQVGSKHPMAKATERTAAIAKAALRQGATLRSAAAVSGLSFAIVADISRGRTWRHVQ